MVQHPSHRSVVAAGITSPGTRIGGTRPAAKSGRGGEHQSHHRPAAGIRARMSKQPLSIFSEGAFISTARLPRRQDLPALASPLQDYATKHAKTWSSPIDAPRLNSSADAPLRIVALTGTAALSPTRVDQTTLLPLRLTSLESPGEPGSFNCLARDMSIPMMHNHPSGEPPRLRLPNEILKNKRKVL